MASAELQEWLDLHDPPAGSYAIHITELDITTGSGTGQVWAQARLIHTRPGDEHSTRGSAAA